MTTAKKKSPGQSAFPIRERSYPKIKKVVPRNKNQTAYMESMDENIVTLGIGPAGSGKTYLATYMGLLYHFDKSNKRRIIITRPAVEAGGEKLGFLPGHLDEKMQPYMRPIYDSFTDLTGLDFLKDKMDRGHIEIAPLAYMRGRTFNNSIIILDEAQNATLSQLKMVLTRIGENCKLVINGDPGQSDLTKKQSGLDTLAEVLRNVSNVGVVEFSSDDIVRHPIVVDIVRAFDTYEETNESD